MNTPTLDRRIFGSIKMKEKVDQQTPDYKDALLKYAGKQLLTPVKEKELSKDEKKAEALQKLRGIAT